METEKRDFVHIIEERVCGRACGRGGRMEMGRKDDFICDIGERGFTERACGRGGRDMKRKSGIRHGSSLSPRP